MNVFFRIFRPFDTSKVTSSSYMTNNVNPLKYINIYNAQINNIIGAFQEKINSNTTVYQNGEIFLNVINDCSIFIQSDNYIIVKYGTETIYETEKFKNTKRQKIQYIKYKGKK